MATDPTRIVETETEGKAGQGTAIVVPTLRLNEKVDPIAKELSALAERAEKVSVWRPLNAPRALARHRKEYATLTTRYREAIDSCHARMSDPVDGGSSMDNAWFQGFSTALGTSALFRLQSAYQAVGEVIDRKAAYTLAVISLYVAMLSMLLTVVFGWLSLPSSQPTQSTPNPAVQGTLRDKAAQRP